MPQAHKAIKSKLIGEVEGLDAFVLPMRPNHKRTIPNDDVLQKVKYSLQENNT